MGVVETDKMVSPGDWGVMPPWLQSVSLEERPAKPVWSVARQHTNPELSGSSDVFVYGGTDFYWIGDYEAGWSAECGTWWKIDVVPL